MSSSRPGIPISILDLAAVGREETIGESFQGSVALARLAELAGYRRVWYAEHHNISSIASSATSVLIAHIACQTETIRLGAGGIMLPNHSPLQIAEQFGTLATLHPGRIDLGLGRAPGTDGATTVALRRDPSSAETFPEDVLELQGFLGDESPIAGVRAIPGQGTRVPLYILGSSLFGAQLAARLGLPYAFASHFAPAEMEHAIHIYRSRFQPSARLEKPYVMLGLNVIAAPTDAEAELLFSTQQQALVSILTGRPWRLPPPVAGYRSQIEPTARAMLDQSLSCSIVGSPAIVRSGLDAFIRRTNADELMVTSQIFDHSARLRSFEILADAHRELSKAG